MKDVNKPDQEDVPVYKERSLVYMGIILGVIILIMGYLTLFVDDPMKIFGGSNKPEKVIDEGESSLLNKSQTMSDDEVKKSLTKFIEAYYQDQRKGYFDPPSYFARITETFYNYHNLNYERLKDIYWKRLANIRNYNHRWIVSSLDFKRDQQRIIATYWARESYFNASLSESYSADIKFEMTIDKDGKIVALRDIDKRNETVARIQQDTVPADPHIEAVNTGTEADENKTYDMTQVETKPEFNGGQKEMNKYIANNIKYPLAARQNNVEGKVYLSFIIEKDGQVNEVKVRQGVGSGCDEEAMRVIRNSPKWKPGMVQGAPVRTYCVLPITFQLN